MLFSERVVHERSFLNDYKINFDCNTIHIVPVVDISRLLTFVITFIVSDILLCCAHQSSFLISLIRDSWYRENDFINIYSR